MKDAQNQFLQLLGQVPGRLTAEQTAWVLNCQSHDIPVLIAAKLLRPLGNPAPNSVKYFATEEILEKTRDRSWLARMTNALYQHWQQKNQAKRATGASNSAESVSVLREAV